MTEPLLTPKDIAKRLSVPPVTVYSWVRKGKIPYYKIEGCVRFSESEFEEWWKSKKKPANMAPLEG